MSGSIFTKINSTHELLIFFTQTNNSYLLTSVNILFTWIYGKQTYRYLKGCGNPCKVITYKHVFH